MLRVLELRLRGGAGTITPRSRITPTPVTPTTTSRTTQPSPDPRRPDSRTTIWSRLLLKRGPPAFCRLLRGHLQQRHSSLDGSVVPAERWAVLRQERWGNTEQQTIFKRQAKAVWTVVARNVGTLPHANEHQKTLPPLSFSPPYVGLLSFWLLLDRFQM